MTNKRIARIGVVVVSCLALAGSWTIGAAAAGGQTGDEGDEATEAQPVASSGTAYDFTGDVQQYTVPAGVHELLVTLSGAEGGDGSSCEFRVTDGLLAPSTCGEGGDAGRGATATTTIPVTPGETLTIVVGGEGEDAETPEYDDTAGVTGPEPVEGGDGGFGYGEGGDGAKSGFPAGAGGGGGGGTAILRGDTVLAVAAGGGGGGGGGSSSRTAAFSEDVVAEGAPATTESPDGGDGGESAESGDDGEPTCEGEGGEKGTATEEGDGGEGGECPPITLTATGDADAAVSFPSAVGKDGDSGDGPDGGDGGAGTPLDTSAAPVGTGDVDAARFAAGLAGAGAGGGGGGVFGGGGGGGGGTGFDGSGAAGGGGGGGNLVPDGATVRDGDREGDGQVLITVVVTVEPKFTG